MRISGVLIACILLTACALEGDQDDSGTAESSFTTAERLKDLRTDARFFRRWGAEPSAPVSLGTSSLFFAKTGRTTAAAEPALFKTNGTKAGTSLVTKLTAPPWGTPAVFADRFYFITVRTVPAPQYAHAYELHRSDGTAAGTSPVLAVNKPGVNVQALAAAPNALYIATVEKTDPGQTVRLLKLTRNPDGTDSVLSLFTTVVPDGWASTELAVNRAGGVLFAAGGTLVRTDGDPANTTVVVSDRKIGRLFATRTRFFFTESSSTVANASELFEVIEAPNATPAPRTRGYGPVAAQDQAASPIETIGSFDDTVLLFTKREMWTVDTASGTLSRYPHDFSKGVTTASFGGKVFALDAYGVIVETDGTVSGTRELTAAQTSSWALSKPATDLVVHNGVPHFVQTVGSHTQQIVSVTGAAKSVVSSFPAGAELASLSSIGGKLYVAAGGYGKELWSIDGARSEMLEVNPFGNASSDAAPVVTVGQKLLFTVNEDVAWLSAENGTEQSLWVTDGSAAGTMKLRTGLYSFLPDRYRTPAAVAIGSRACLLEQVAFRTSIVCTDGTSAGTTSDSYAYQQAPVVRGNSVYYARWGAGGNGQDVVRYDATLGTTTVLASLTRGSTVHDIVARDNDIMFLVESPDAAARGIWTSDGTQAGTLRMAANVPFISERERVLGRMGQNVFVAAPSTNGGALYKLDGSATGVVRVKDIPYSRPPSFGTAAVLGSKLIFPVEGALWVSEGTPETTFALVTPAGRSDSFFHYAAECDGRAAFSTGAGVVVTDGTVAGTWRHEAGSSLVTVAAIPGKGFVVSNYDQKNLFLLSPQGATPLETNRGTYMNLAPLAMNGGLVFPGPLDNTGTELLFTNGSVNGTRVVADMATGAASSDPSHLHVGLGRLWFSAEDASGDRELYSVRIANVN